MEFTKCYMINAIRDGQTAEERMKRSTTRNTYKSLPNDFDRGGVYSFIEAMKAHAFAARLLNIENAPTSPHRGQWTNGQRLAASQARNM